MKFKASRCAVYVLRGKKTPALLVKLDKDEEKLVLTYIQALKEGSIEVYPEPQPIFAV